MRMPSLAAACRSLLVCTLAFACAAAQSAAPVESVTVSKDGAGFVLNPSGARFTPWGFNYDRDYRHRLIEEYWNTEWATVEQDFRLMKALGANVVRLHLQFAQFMESPDKPNRINLARLEKLVRLADQIGLYLDITGLGSYRASAIPAWYSGISQTAHWDAQAAFWEAIAGACSGRPGVFAYNLMNEPVVSCGSVGASERVGRAPLRRVHQSRSGRPPALRDRQAVGAANGSLAGSRAVASHLLSVRRLRDFVIGFLQIPSRDEHACVDGWFWS
jgi:hypothetical protein